MRQSEEGSVMIMEFDTGLKKRAIRKFIFVSLDISRRIRDNNGRSGMTEQMQDLIKQKAKWPPKDTGIVFLISF